MKLSEALPKVMRLAGAIQDYWDAELPKRYANYPLVGPGEEDGPPPREEEELKQFLESLPDETLYQILFLVRLAKGYFAPKKWQSEFQEVRNQFPTREFAIAGLLGVGILADLLTDALAELQKAGIELDALGGYACVSEPVPERPRKSIADQLPPEIAALLHPDRRKNEAAYWTVRDQLLEPYRNLWVGFADDKIVASGTSAVAVLHAAEATGLHPFVICVGREDVPCRIRRVSFPYDASYPDEPLPVIDAEFRQASGSPGIVLDRVIPDTGADASVLPWADCQRLQLDPNQGVQGLLSGVAGSSTATLVFHIWVWLDGQEFACRLQADFTGNERILGRDVLNRLKVLFNGPSSDVVLNP